MDKNSIREQRCLLQFTMPALQWAGWDAQSQAREKIYFTNRIDEFLQRWRIAERKQAIVAEFEAGGLPLVEIRQALGKDLDPFDLMFHFAFEALAPDEARELEAAE